MRTAPPSPVVVVERPAYLAFRAAHSSRCFFLPYNYKSPVSTFVAILSSVFRIYIFFFFLSFFINDYCLASARYSCPLPYVLFRRSPSSFFVFN